MGAYTINAPFTRLSAHLPADTYRHYRIVTISYHYIAYAALYLCCLLQIQCII